MGKRPWRIPKTQGMISRNIKDIALSLLAWVAFSSLADWGIVGKKQRTATVWYKYHTIPADKRYHGKGPLVHKLRSPRVDLGRSWSVLLGHRSDVAMGFTFANYTHRPFVLNHRKTFLCKLSQWWSEVPCFLIGFWPNHGALDRCTWHEAVGIDLGTASSLVSVVTFFNPGVFEVSKIWPDHLSTLSASTEDITKPIPRWHDTQSVE